LFERKKAEEQYKVYIELTSDNGLKNLSGCSSSVPGTEQTSIRSNDVFDISNESCSSTAAIDFQTKHLDMSHQLYQENKNQS